MASIERESIMIVDDTSLNISLVVEILRDEYNLIVANNGRRALDIIATGKHPDLILLDIMMPELDGFQVLEKLKADPETAMIPVIFVTARSDVSDETEGLYRGAVDYITKPLNPDLLRARVGTHLRLRRAESMLRDRAGHLETEVQKRLKEIRLFQDVTVRAMASLAETRDNETGNHILRTQNYVLSLAKRMASNPKYSGLLDDAYVRKLFVSAPLHDIGKVGIPDHILLKPGKLTPEEFEVMKTHTTIGYNSIVRAEASSEIDLNFLDLAKEIALYHQEKWDGSGYPEGLRGEQIPLSARLMALADVYDALISKRVYKDAYSHREAMDIMRKGRATHFDPDIFDHFIEIEDEFVAIAEKYRD